MAKADIVSDQIRSRERLIARWDLFHREKEFAGEHDQLSVERCILALEQVKRMNSDRPDHEVSLAGRSRERSSFFIKRSTFRLLGLIGVPLAAAVYLFLELSHTPHASLNHSLLNAILSLLVNVSSSAILKGFWFLVSLLGASKSFIYREPV